MGANMRNCFTENEKNLQKAGYGRYSQEAITLSRRHGATLTAIQRLWHLFTDALASPFVNPHRISPLGFCHARLKTVVASCNKALEPQPSAKREGSPLDDYHKKP
jgi:hypothetical protein